MGQTASTSLRPIVIEPGRADRRYWVDLWEYRDLFLVLAWRDVAVRYKQTLIGTAWAVVQPVLSMLVFTIVFGRIAKLPSDGSAPYALMVMAGLLPWQLFASSLSGAANSLIGNANLIGKVYFPRLIVPTSAMAVALVDFLVGLVIFFTLLLANGVLPGWRVVFLPVLFLMALLASLGPSLWIASLNVKYRDFRYVVPFILQFGLYVSPVGFSAAVVPESWRTLYSVNPMVAVIGGFRWALLPGAAPPSATSLASWAMVSASLLWLGIRQFRRMERQFADVI